MIYLQNDSKRPNVNFIAMSYFSVQYLRGNVIRSATNSPLLLAIELQLGRQAEVAYLDFQFFVQEQVPQFKTNLL